MKRVSRRKFLKTLGIGALSGAVSGTYFGDCADWLSLERHEVRLKRWGANGFKVALLADLHVNSEKQALRAERAVAMALDEKPDLVVMAGDFLNRSAPEYLQNLTRALEPLSGAACPCVAVLGNHDYTCRSPQLIVDTIAKTPLRLLINGVFDTQGISVVGIDDAIFRLSRFDFFPVGSVSTDCLAVLHEPDYVSMMPEHASIQVSGHSHGGQICLPFGVALHTPAGSKKYISGFYRKLGFPSM